MEKLREKIAAQREKRLLKERLLKTKTLGDGDDVEDTSSWVSKSRKIEKDRKEAEKRVSERVLEELFKCYEIDVTNVVFSIFQSITIMQIKRLN